MRRFFIVLLIAGTALVVLAVVAPGLPAGNPIKGIGQSIRSVGEGIGNSFGGGYGQLPSGG